MGTPDVVRLIAPRETWELRQCVLRPHQRVDEMEFPGDTEPDAAHFGVFVREQLVAIASIYRRPPKGHPDDGLSWQLRGMATLPWVRGTGRGAAALHACEAHCARHDARLLWCNARLHAVGFYERHGFTVASEPFDVPCIGPHLVMMKALGERAHGSTQP